MATRAENDDSKVRHHLVALLVENKSGVLARVAGLFSRRGFNIFSLAVAPSHDPRFSRVSIVVDVESAPLQQVVDQLNKLVNVVEIHELHPDDAREAELLLVTVSVDDEDLAEVQDLAAASGGRVVDSVAGALTLLLAGAPEVVDDFEDAVLPHGVIELQRTGRIALPKLAAEDAGS